MNAEHVIVNKVREMLGNNVALLWHDNTKVLVMSHPVFRFAIVDWYAWNQYVQGSNYNEYAKHIAVSFTEAIILNEMADKLLTKFPYSDRIEITLEDIDEEETNED